MADHIPNATRRPQGISSARLLTVSAAIVISTGVIATILGAAILVSPFYVNGGLMGVLLNAGKTAPNEQLARDVEKFFTFVFGGILSVIIGLGVTISGAVWTMFGMGFTIGALVGIAPKRRNDQPITILEADDSVPGSLNQ